MSTAREEAHILYELCVQKPAAVVALIRRVHSEGGDGGSARVLHEDFCGTGAVSRAWVASDSCAAAVATDLDAEAVKIGNQRAREEGVDGSRLQWRIADVRAAWDVPPAVELATAIFVGNFSMGELHDRGELVAYLRAARARLARHGVLICDTYGGAAAYRTGLVHRTHAGRSPTERILYTWEQRSVDPFTMRVVNSLHFRVERDGEIVAACFDSFVYDWRLWSVAELRDAMLEAGFANIRIVDRVDGESPGSIDPCEHHIVCVAADRDAASDREERR